MTTKRVIYTSLLCPSLEAANIEDMLHQARRNNLKSAISGILIIGDDDLVQCLEGETSRIDALIDRIKSDHRHHAVKIVSEETDVKRIFGEWSMGYVSTTNHDLAERLGFSGVLSHEAISEKLSRSTELATTFISGFISILRGQNIDVSEYLIQREQPAREVFLH